MVETVHDILRLGLTRKAAESVWCPKCRALAGNPCTGRRTPTNERTSPHIQRYDRFARIAIGGQQR